MYEVRGRKYIDEQIMCDKSKSKEIDCRSYEVYVTSDKQ